MWIPDPGHLQEGSNGRMVARKGNINMTLCFTQTKAPEAGSAIPGEAVWGKPQGPSIVGTGVPWPNEGVRLLLDPPLLCWERKHCIQKRQEKGKERQHS